jgi:uncharacterized membrane protein
MRAENFLYFATVSGFFIGIIFAILKSAGFLDFLVDTFLLTAIFHLIALGTIAFFVKHLDIKKMVFFNKQEAEEILDVQIGELEKKENFILQSYEFIRQIEQEEMEIIRKNRK